MDIPKEKWAKPGEYKTPAEIGYGELAQWADMYCDDGEVAHHVAWRYAAKVLAPRRLAQARRKAGDPSASLRDYECGCPLSAADGKPRCFGHRKTCRFRDRYEAPPRISNDPLRHQAEKDVYNELLAELRALPHDQAMARVSKMVDWYDAQVLRKRDHYQCADA